MIRFPQAPLILALLAAASICAVGCGGSRSASAEGTVTLDGDPIEYGIIRFELSDGESFSAPIKEGRYSVPEAIVGEATVTFTVRPKPPEVSSREELEQLAGQPAQQPAKQIPRDHPQQGQKVEIDSGANTLDFAL